MDVSSPLRIPYFDVDAVDEPPTGHGYAVELRVTTTL
jgi:hypothetical protein